MGTSYSVKAVGVPREIETGQIQADVDAILRQVNDVMSTYDDDSELSRFNRSRSTDWVIVSTDLLAVVDKAIRVSHLSGGAFDVTVGPLVNLWGFGPGPVRGEMPTADQIQAAATKVGYQRLHVRDSPPALRKDDPDLYVDLSAIAKGYGVDQVATYLEGLGIESYLVEIGGDLRAKGDKEPQTPWRIGIEQPTPADRRVQKIIPIRDGAVATSGDYRNFFEVGDQRFSHAIDPRTGRPVTHNLASVTVISTSAMHADAMATALLVMGAEAGFQLAERENLAAYFLVDNGEGFSERSTSAFQKRLMR